MKPNYLGIYIALGAGIGVAFGGATHHMAQGLALGVAFGVAIGVLLDREIALMFETNATDLTAIDALTAVFYDAFTNRNGAVPRIDRLHELFIPGAAIIKAVGAVAQIYDLAGFIAPRLAILTDGTLTDFSEEEVSAKTEIFGNIAQRFSRYRKSWAASGAHFEGGGAKSIQLIRTSDGWKIASLTWDDEAVIGRPA